MSQIIFTSNRKFRIVDFFDSHSQLLIRSSKSSQFEKNIDIIFFNVNFQHLSTNCDGVSIKKIQKVERELDSITAKKTLEYDDNSLFEIVSNNETYYLVASFFRVYENMLDSNESSLGVLEVKGRELEIASSI